MSQSNLRDPSKIRNIAIIAHIDHGKTTMLDAMLKQSGIFRENEATQERMMDSNDQEKERGITIFAKHTSVYFGDYKINIIDTPGHADFAGEVERVLGMVNCVLLLVDAQEGPMPQTRFVLSRALRAGLKPIVVINKIDRPNADPDSVHMKTLELFYELGATAEQADFKICYASGLAGFAIKDLKDPRVSMQPLFEMILEEVPPPPGNLDLPFLMQSASISYDSFTGRQACGRILEGKVKVGTPFLRVDKDGFHTRHSVTRIDGYLGLKKITLDEAGAGDIVSIAGAPEIMIGDTLCDPAKVVQLPPIDIGKPTISVEMSVNSSPFVGKEGAKNKLTINTLRDRLSTEQKANVSLSIQPVEGSNDWIRISGRGELHISVLLESMRREGYEFSVAKPKVILQMRDGINYEPIERVHIEVPAKHQGEIMDDILSKRKGELLSLEENEYQVCTFIFNVPTRGLLGYRNDFLTRTRGLGILTSIFDHYAPWKGDIEGRKLGVLISNSTGKATPHSLFSLQDRGTLFIPAGTDVYEGMIIGQHSRDNDLVVNPVKGKQLTNVRASGTDENVILTPPRILPLEEAINYIEDDELVEITPVSIRLRKKFLTEVDRKRGGR